MKPNIVQLARTALPTSAEMEDIIMMNDHPDLVICKLLYTDEMYTYDFNSNSWIPRTTNDINNSIHVLTRICDTINKSTNADRTSEEFGNVSSLGASKTNYPTDYDPSVLEYFLNKHSDNDYVVSLDAYEFSSLCPKTHQPDFAKVVISYIPNEKMVESKSLKLYLFSFRNHGSFHEDCMNTVMEDLIKLMDPKYIEVRGIFAPRGGISIFPFCNWANPKFNYQTFANQRKLDILRDSSNRASKFDV